MLLNGGISLNQRKPVEPNRYSTQSNGEPVNNVTLIPFRKIGSYLGSLKTVQEGGVLTSSIYAANHKTVYGLSSLPSIDFHDVVPF